MKIPDRGNQISALVADNLKFPVFMFKKMEHCSKAYDIKHVNRTSMLQYQPQWELEQKKADNTEASKVERNNWATIMENIVLHLKLIREIRGLIGLCGLVPCQGGMYLIWIWCLSEP